MTETINVVGAGFSGLTTAYFLTKKGFKVRIFEKSDRAGGLIRTIRTEHGLVETAANGLLSSARAEAMCADLGVPLIMTRREGRRRFIYRGKPKQIPLTIGDLLTVSGRVALNLTKWMVRLPKRQVIQDENGAAISRSESFYDDETFSGNNLGGVDKGNLTLRRDWIDPASATGNGSSSRRPARVSDRTRSSALPATTPSGARASWPRRARTISRSAHSFLRRRNRTRQPRARVDGTAGQTRKLAGLNRTVLAAGAAMWPMRADISSGMLRR